MVEVLERFEDRDFCLLMAVEASRPGVLLFQRLSERCNVPVLLNDVVEDALTQRPRASACPRMREWCTVTRCLLARLRHERRPRY